MPELGNKVDAMSQTRWCLFRCFWLRLKVTLITGIWLAMDVDRNDGLFRN
jgi:hypothetical protein